MIRYNEPGYQRCVVTLMDTTDPDISFNEHGVSNWVTDVYARTRRSWDPEGRPEAFQRTIDKIKQAGRGRPYDCILGLSGGVDSSYLAYLAWRAGLRPLVVHTDTGWNSEIAVNNIERIVKTCGFELHTNVIDWHEMADLQRAFLRARVSNQDIPQDHAIFAALYRFAVRNGVRCVLSGSNYATESVLPRAWSYDHRDATHIRAIHRRFGSIPLKSFPIMGHVKFGIEYRLARRMRVVNPLNLVPYERQEAIAILEREFRWKHYGAKHFESRWTRFFQGYWLPAKFGYDKRLAHLSSLILSGQMTRDEALLELGTNSYSSESIQDDKEFILRKLNFAEREFDELFRSPNCSHHDYPTNETLKRWAKSGRELLRNVRSRLRRVS
jgi:N-acetyl sugar amidotransferase